MAKIAAWETGRFFVGHAGAEPVTDQRASPPEDELPGRPIEAIIHADAHHVAGEFCRSPDECALVLRVDGVERQGADVVMQIFDLAGPRPDAVFEPGAQRPSP